MDLVLSVLMTTQDKATYLDLTLATLEKQALPMEIWEVVVWDDRSNDATSTILDKYQERARLNLLRRCSQERFGSLAARNAALEVTSGRIIVFLADDHLVPEDFLAHHLKHHRNICQVVIGDIHRCVHTHMFVPAEPAMAGCSPIPAVDAEDLYKEMDWKWLVAEASSDYQPVFDYFQCMNGSPASPWIFFNASNASAPRAKVVELQGFDEQLNGFGLEDYDLARRLYRAGLQFHYEPQAYSLHQRHPKAAIDGRLLHADINRFLWKHPDMDRLERQMVVRGKYPL